MRSADLFRRADALLEQALERPPGERVAFVLEASADDGELRDLALRLLRDAEEDDPRLLPGGALALTLPRDGRTPDDDERLAEGERLGPYRVIRELNRGGMAMIYLGERVDGQLDQQVALKVIKRGLDTDEVLHRFRQEGQIMALAQHPSIARVFDAGVAADGRPYFAMELVDGLPIDQFCDRNRLSVGERLGLFVEAARAVAYAHRNLVVHRDIKPSNILVTPDRQVKLLDFGIAKILSDQGTDHRTRTGMRFLTPAWASPELITGQPVTTASDVYQLGVLLYVLLAGCSPHRADVAGPELLESITRDAPQRPSTALRGSPSLLRIAVARASTPRKLCRRLTGDLDNIALMALRKEPDRRYDSVASLVQDVERHLTGRPVTARPDTIRYRLGKLVSRNRTAAALAGGLVVSLAASAVVLGVQARRLAIERDRASTEAAAARQVSELLVEMFRSSDPHEARGAELSAREILDRGAAEMTSKLEDQPLIRARLEAAVGQIREHLGLLDEAAANLARARDLYADAAGPDDAETGTATRLLADVRLRQGRFEEAETLYRESIETLTAALGPDAPETARARHNLGNLYWTTGRFDLAEPLYEEALASSLARHGENHSETANARNSLGLLYVRLARYPQAEDQLRRALQWREQNLGEDHPLTLTSMNNVAYAENLQGRTEAAVALYERALQGQSRVIGEDHPDTLNTRTNLAAAYFALGRRAEAATLFREIYAVRRKTLGDTHPDTLAALLNVGVLQFMSGQLQEATGTLEEALRLHREHLGPEHPETLLVMENLAEACLRGGQIDRSRRLFDASWKARSRVLGPDHPDTLDSLVGLAKVALAEDDPAAARRTLQQALRAGYSLDRLREAPSLAPFHDDPALTALAGETAAR